METIKVQKIDNNVCPWTQSSLGTPYCVQPPQKFSEKQRAGGEHPQ